MDVIISYEVLNVDEDNMAPKNSKDVCFEKLKGIKNYRKKTKK